MVALSRLPEDTIANDFAYNKFATAPYGLVAKMGAMATLTLPGQRSADAGRVLRLTTVSGNSFEAPVHQGLGS